MNEKARQRIYDNMDAVRKARNLTKAALADAMGVSRASIYSANNGTTPSLDRLEKFCLATGCPMSALVDGAVDPEDYRIPDGIEGMWPYNLACAIQSYGYGRTSEDGFDRHVYAPGILAALESLTERQQKVITLRFRSMMTLEDVAKEMGVTRERVRQVEARALRELARPQAYNLWYMVPRRELLDVAEERDRARLECVTLRQKLERFMEAHGIPKEAAGPGDECMGIKLDAMDLSVRSYNVLKRAGIDTVGQLRGLTVGDLKKFRNMGLKSLKEVVSKAADFGIEIAE